MNALRRAIHEYLALRRGLGFKLQDAGNGLLDFAGFMERHRASYITEELAVAWAQQSSNVQPARWAARLGYIRAFARHRSATDPRTQIPHPGYCLSNRSELAHTCTRMERSKGYCEPRLRCRIVMNAEHCGPGSTTVYSGC
jgi:hypothetical protein